MKQEFKCRFCQSKSQTGGICLGCGSLVRDCQEKPKVDETTSMVRYCPHERCRVDKRRERRQDGYFVCVGCGSAYEPEEFVVSHRDPSIAAEKDEEFQKKRTKARNRRPRH